MEESRKCMVCGKIIGYRWKGICLGCRYRERLAKAGISLRGAAAGKAEARAALKCDPKKLPRRGAPAPKNMQEKKSPPFWEYYRPWGK